MKSLVKILDSRNCMQVSTLRYLLRVDHFHVAIEDQMSNHSKQSLLFRPEEIFFFQSHIQSMILIQNASLRQYY